MPTATVTTSAAGSLALLEDEDKDIRVYAITHLLQIIPTFWAEISEKVAYIELLADPLSKELPSDQRPYAALLCSKIYFYLGLLSEAVEFALQAGKAFQSEQQSEYRETIIAGCLDRAIEETEEGKVVDARLAEIVESVLRSGQNDSAKLAIGLSLSLRRLDLLEMIYVTSRSPIQPTPQAGIPAKHTTPVHDESLLRYILNEVVIGSSGNDSWPTEFRDELLQLLLRLFKTSPKTDYPSTTQIYILLNLTSECASTIITLIESGNLAEAWQIGFDVCEFGSQGFVGGVRVALGEKGWLVEEKLTEPSDDPKVIINQILLGFKSAELFLNFLQKNNKSDLSILKGTKDILEDRYSIYHSALTFAHAFTVCGTTSDKFLRENLDWLGRASNWSKFSATAALGGIHKGSYINGSRVIKPYLPEGSSPNVYSEGGALFALGLVYSGRRELAEGVLSKYLGEGWDSVVQHGAALGLGVCALSTQDEDLYEQVRTLLYQDNATSGEASGYAMGLIMLGSGSEKVVDEMLTYAKETQHEKIIRSLAVGIGLVNYGRRDGANPLIESLMNEKDSILRYGAMFTLAQAHAGTASNWAIRKLLHVAVSDVSDDVRRAAVTALGFVMFRNHTQVPRVVQLLAESYNPHVRHGATLALGISCAGTGLEAAIDLLEPMTKDPIDFVRQGAYISLAMILIQQTETSCPKSVAIRELFSKVVNDTREDPMARFGASLAQGIIDAGGRNMTLSMSTRAGTNNMKAIVGMVLFVQFWYWFPLAHGLSLAFQPTALIALDEKLRVPDIGFDCHSRPSLYAYPAVEKKVKEDKKAKAKTAVLSTTAKSNARARTKKAEQGESMDLDEKPETDDKSPETSTPKKERRPSEPSLFTVKNMTRVTPSQLSFLAIPSSQTRYQPIRPIGDSSPEPSTAGNTTITTSSTSPLKPKSDGGRGRLTSGSIVILRDTAPEKEDGEYIKLDESLWPVIPVGSGETLVTQEEAAAPTAIIEEEEAEMPAAFEYDFE